MKRCLCCGLPTAGVFCPQHLISFLTPWRYPFASKAWTSATLTARNAEIKAVEQRFWA